MKENAMQNNRETAMSLWSKRYGKANKVNDFAGRVMIKAAYNDRNSDYGWNLDHILPQSRGGKTTESNLVCCHILTNDEKGDSFPCFTANGKQLEIIKVENHYEIRQKSPDKSVAEAIDEPVNFYDGTAGVRLYDTIKKSLARRPFVGTVIVKLYDMKETALLEFIRNLFSDKAFSYDGDDNCTTTIRIIDYFMFNKEDSADILERCVVLNTYLTRYFVPTGAISSYNIYFGEHIEKNKRSSIFYENSYNLFWGDNNMYINEWVVKHCGKVVANLNMRDTDEIDYLCAEVYEFNYINTNLAENLARQVSGD